MNPELDGLTEIAKLFSIGRVTTLFLSVVILWGLVHVLNRVSSSLGQRFPSRRLLVLQVVTILSFALYIGGGALIVYGVLRPPKELLIALGGSAAVAIGLSLKDLVSSLVAGLILLFDRPFQVGDRVTFADTYGEIQSIGLRAVRLVTLDDNLVTIPNSRFITDVVASGNAGALDMMICVDFYVALGADLDLAKEIIFETVVTSRYVYLQKPVTVVAAEKVVAERISVELKANAYVLDVKFEKAFQTDIVTRVERAFVESQVGRPARDPMVSEA